MLKRHRFQKKILNSEDHKNIDNGAKAVKGICGAIVAVVTLKVTKDSMRTLLHTVTTAATKLIKK